MTDPALPDWLTTATTIGYGVLIAYTLLETVLILGFKRGKSARAEYLQPVKNLLFVGGTSWGLRTLALSVSALTLAPLGASLAPLPLPSAWWMWPVALLTYEFWYWVQHWAAHKVRILWCIHSPHHAPEEMNMVMGFNHHALEVLVYFPFFFGFMPALCGIPVEMVLTIAIIDIVWGSLLHAAPGVIARDYGPLEYILQTPNRHRVHHGRNQAYIDTNYNSITLFWDWAFGTLTKLDPADPVDLGIRRPVNDQSFWDVQFGEFAALWRDMAAAPSLKTALRYAVMPPGWAPAPSPRPA